MPKFVPISNERSNLSSPVAIKLVDAFTLETPIGKTSLTLQEEVAPGNWLSLNLDSFQGRDGVYSYPGLGRCTNVNRPPGNFRVFVQSDVYEPYEPSELEEFPVVPFNNANPLAPGEYAQGVRQVTLQPNSNYPYESHVLRVTGRVTKGDKSGTPLEGAELRHQSLKVFSNRKGEFTLPIRIPAQDTQTIEKSELNKIKVRNATGYSRAQLKIRFDGSENFFKVDELIWKDLSTPPKNHEATLTLEPLNEGDDLPANLPVATNVSLVKFALLMDIPPLGQNEIDVDFLVDPSSGFQQFQRIVIPTH